VVVVDLQPDLHDELLSTMATALKHLKVVDLTQDVLDAALDCVRQVNNLKFQSRGDYEVCDDGKGLKGASGALFPNSLLGQNYNPLKAAMSSNLIFGSNQFGIWPHT
jgi:hypothetical protein